jgi:PAS domain S-box-containing protein
MYRLIECLDFLALPRLGSGRILKVGIDAERGMNQRAEGEDRYRSLFQNSHAVMLLIDSESGEIADANPAACRFYGWTLEELRGLTIDRINTLSPQQIQAEMQRAREQKREHFYFNHRLANGEIRNVEVYSNPVRIAGRTLLYSIVHDITERRRAEEERDRFFDLSGDLFCIGGFDGYLRQINPAWTRLLGWSEEDLLGRPWLDFVHPEDREKTAQNDRNMKNGLAAQNFENRFLRKDGSWRWLSWNVCLLPERGLVFAVARDVTGKKQAEQQIERLPGGGAGGGRDSDHRCPGVIQYVNPAFTRMTGFEAREILGQTPSVLDSGEREAGNYEHLWKTILAGQVWQGRITTRRRDGSLFECESTISPLCAEPGRVVSCVQVARDVTTEHRLEAQHEAGAEDGIDRDPGGGYRA